MVHVLDRHRSTSASIRLCEKRFVAKNTRLGPKARAKVPAGGGCARGGRCGAAQKQAEIYARLF